MPLLDVADDTFVRVPPGRVRAETAGRWADWLPGLDLTVSEDRGAKGVRWLVPRSTAVGLPPCHGTAEVWLEPVGDGTVVHLYVRLDPVREQPSDARRARAFRDRLRRSWKRDLHGWKDLVEAYDRSPAPAGGRPSR